MYRRPKSLEAILEVRQQMAREADFDVDLFVEMVRSGSFEIEEQSAEIEGVGPEEGTGIKAA